MVRKRLMKHQNDVTKWILCLIKGVFYFFEERRNFPKVEFQQIPTLNNAKRNLAENKLFRNLLLKQT